MLLSIPCHFEEGTTEKSSAADRFEAEDLSLLFEMPSVLIMLGEIPLRRHLFRRGNKLQADNADNDHQDKAKLGYRYFLLKV